MDGPHAIFAVTEHIAEIAGELFELAFKGCRDGERNKGVEGAFQTPT